MNAKTFRPTLESLETRLTPAVTAYLKYGSIMIQGTGVRDVVSVSEVYVGGAKHYQVNEFVNETNIQRGPLFPAAKVGAVICATYGGKDQFSNVTNLKSYVDGGAGDDVLNGGSNNDTLIGGSGNDVISGRVGDDALYGGTGYDQITGDDGRDYLDGGNDGCKDWLLGGSDADTFMVERVWSGGRWVNRDLPDGWESFDRFVGPK